MPCDWDMSVDGEVGCSIPVLPFFMPEPGLDRGGWLEKLMRISQDLQRQGASARLTLVGSVTGILAGQPARTSMDLDVWKPQSQYQY